jgi:hypothetical protein
MVESITEASRPARRRTRRPPASVQKQASDTIFKGIDRLGLAPVMLLVGGWWAASKVLEPLITEYRDAIRAISETNRLLKDEVTQNDAEDNRRVELITGLQGENRALLLAIQKQLEAMQK